MTNEERERARIGRPPLPVDQKTIGGTVKLTPARWAKLRRLGSAWLGQAIDKAKEPPPKE